jgi:hypothetical protein
MDIYIHYAFLFLHIIFIVIGFGAVVVVDTFGLLWLLKKIPLKTVTTTAEITQRLIWIGWFGLVFTGSILLLSKNGVFRDFGMITRMNVSDLTWIKLFLVSMLGANGIFLHFIKRSMEKLNNPEDLPKIIMFRTSLASTISQMGWWGAFTIGFINTNTHFSTDLPFNPLTVMILILLGISLAVLVGEMVLNRKKAEIVSEKLVS